MHATSLPGTIASTAAQARRYCLQAFIEPPKRSTAAPKKCRTPCQISQACHPGVSPEAHLAQQVARKSVSLLDDERISRCCPSNQVRIGWVLEHGPCLRWRWQNCASSCAARSCGVGHDVNKARHRLHRQQMLCARSAACVSPCCMNSLHQALPTEVIATADAAGAGLLLHLHFVLDVPERGTGAPWRGRARSFS